ncbi:MAG: hypothetical protein ABFD07_19720 [Methanobacterium sp.]
MYISNLYDIYNKNIMDTFKLKNSLDNFTNPTITKSVSDDGMETEQCDLQTGECYTIRSVDGIVERINKKYVTDDGRQLLQD